MICRRCTGGFTLLETLLVLVLVSVAAALLLPYMRSGLDQSAQVPLQLVQSGALSGQMAQIVARNTNDLESLRIQLLAEGVQAGYITFPASPPYEAIAGGNELLQVVLTDAAGHRLVTLLREP